MPRPKKVIPSSLTVADLKALLAAKEKVELLQARKAELEAELRGVNKELAQLQKGAGAAAPARKQRPKKSAALKRGASNKGKKRAAAGVSGGPTIESIVVGLLKDNGGPMAFQDVLATIKKKRLIKTKAANFDGVLRQSMAKSTKIKRVGRGVYRA